MAWTQSRGDRPLQMCIGDPLIPLEETNEGGNKDFLVEVVRVFTASTRGSDGLDSITSWTQGQNR